MVREDFGGRRGCEGGVVDLEVEAGEVVVGDGCAVDPDALVDAGEVGRGVEGGAVAGGGEGWRRGWRRWSLCHWFQR